MLYQKYAIWENWSQVYSHSRGKYQKYLSLILLMTQTYFAIYIKIPLENTFKTLLLKPLEFLKVSFAFFSLNNCSSELFVFL